MPVYIALLRGINVGGKRMKMAVLRDALTGIGLSDVQTILASGNVIFRSEENQETLVTNIENAIHATFGFESKIIIRTPQQIEAAIAKNPFNVAEVETKLLHVNFLRNAPAEEKIATFQQSHEGIEQVHIFDEEVFIYFVDGSARSKLNIEKSLDVIGTARNWNTVLKLEALAKDIKS